MIKSHLLGGLRISNHSERTNNKFKEPLPYSKCLLDSRHFVYINLISSTQQPCEFDLISAEKNLSQRLTCPGHRALSARAKMQTWVGRNFKPDSYILNIALSLVKKP